jgi:hypothetical protein
MVAGANRIDLLLDLREAVDKAISGGATLQDFRRDFDAIVARHGWAYNGGRNWRTRVIFETNLRTSYAAGRYEQLQKLKKVRPYWRYIHSDSVQHPRPLHVAWHGKILHADDPWWQTHYPPNGWGCQCRVESLDEAGLRRHGKTAPDAAPSDGTALVTVGKRGPNPQVVETPNGVDPGFGYAPGRDAWLRRQAGHVEQRATRLPPEQREKALAALQDIQAMRRALPAVQAARTEAQALASLRNIAGDDGMDKALAAIRGSQLPAGLTESQAVALHLWSQDTAPVTLPMPIPPCCNWRSPANSAVRHCSRPHRPP